MKTEQQLLNLKKDVDTAKTTVSELTGQFKSLMKQAKDDWQCSTVDIAKKKLSSMDDEIVKIDQKIIIGIQELEDKYDIL